MAYGKNIDGLIRYKDLLSKVFLVDDISSLSKSDFEGCVGVCIVRSVMDGVRNDVRDISRYLKFYYNDEMFINVYNRLKSSGVLNKNYNINNDNVLLGYADDTRYLKSEERAIRAWCNIAGVASGYVGCCS